MLSGHSNIPPALAIPGADPRLYNHDPAPVASAGRTWRAFSIFAIWMSDVLSVGGYAFAASLFWLVTGHYPSLPTSASTSVQHLVPSFSFQVA